MKILSIVATFLTLSSSLVVSLGSCGQGAGVDSSKADTLKVSAGASQAPIAYDLENPTVFNMPDDLREISGISFYQGDPALLYAEQDEKGRLYWLKLGDEKAAHADFGKDGDYEDLAFTRQQVVILKSNGNLYSVDVAPTSNGGKGVTLDAGKVEEWKGLLPKGEYEGLYADTGKNQLYVLCKECKNEDHKKTVSIFRLDNNGSGWTLGETSQVDVSRISELAAALKDGGKNKKLNFKPSAISWNPLTSEWYILSSVNKMLVVTGADWKVKAVHLLNNRLYPQPEGMCFDRDNNLYISNEGPQGGTGTVYKFELKEM